MNNTSDTLSFISRNVDVPEDEGTDRSGDKHYTES